MLVQRPTTCSQSVFPINIRNIPLHETRLDNLLNEKENVEREFNAFQREVKHSSLADTAKEIRVLKKVIKNLEVTEENYFSEKENLLH